MKKIATKVLMCAMVLASVGSISSCKDYADDVTFEQAQSIETLKKQIAEMNKIIAELQGQAGCECPVWTIGDDGYWYKDGIKTDKKAVGTDGQNGQDGQDGQDADVWTIGEDGYWYKNKVKTEYKAIGEDGQDGQDGQDGIGLTEKEREVLRAIIGLQDQIVNSISFYNKFQQGLDEAGLTVSDLIRIVKENENTIEQLNALLERLDKVENSLKSLVTGIIAQGTENPLYGTFALPTGTNSKVLIAFHGNADNVVIFPTAETGNNVKASGTLTSTDWAMIERSLNASYKTKAGMLVNDEQGDPTDADESGIAGHVYVTVNPSNVDFTGATLQLVNSQDEEAVTKLGALKKSNKVLSFGYTRADNGFYEAPALISKDDMDQASLHFSGYGLKSAFTDMLKQRNMSSIATFTGKFYNLMEGNKIPALALKANYTDDMDVERNIYSEYGIAATAVEPLSYSFLEDMNMVSLPGYNRVENFINRTAKALKSRIAGAFKNLTGGSLFEDIKNLKINKIEIKDLSDETLNQFKMSFNINKTFDLGGKKMTFDIDQEVELPIVFSTKADLGGLTFKLPVITIVGEGTVPMVRIPLYEDKNGNGKMDEGEEVLGEDGKPMYSEFPATGVEIVGQTEDGVEVTLPDGTFVNIDVNQVITTRLTLKDLEFEIPNDGSFSFTIDETFDVDMTSAIKDLWKDVQGQMDGVNDMLQQFQKVLDDVNSSLDQINNFESSLTNSVDDIKVRIMKYLDIINSKAVNFVNNINKRIQPRLVVATTDGAKMLSGARNYPTTVNQGNVTLVPTSYTAEVVTPALKKHIAVVDVLKGNESAQGGNANCLSVLDEVNGQSGINQVLEGSTVKVPVTLKKGYTYVIAYSALDFHGKISVNKYYVRY